MPIEYGGGGGGGDRALTNAEILLSWHAAADDDPAISSVRSNVGAQKKAFGAIHTTGFNSWKSPYQEAAAIYVFIGRPAFAFLPAGSRKILISVPYAATQITPGLVCLVVSPAISLAFPTEFCRPNIRRSNRTPRRFD